MHGGLHHLHLDRGLAFGLTAPNLRSAMTKLDCNSPETANVGFDTFCTTVDVPHHRGTRAHTSCASCVHSSCTPVGTEVTPPPNITGQQSNSDFWYAANLDFLSVWAITRGPPFSVTMAGPALLKHA